MRGDGGLVRSETGRAPGAALKSAAVTQVLRDGLGSAPEMPFHGVKNRLSVEGSRTAFLKVFYYHNTGLGPSLSRDEIQTNMMRQFNGR